MKRVIATFLLSMLAHGFAFRPELAGSPLFWWTFGLTYAVLVAIALHKMWDDGTLVDLLAPRWGDLSIGMVTASLLLVCSWAARGLLSPEMTPRQAWLVDIYVQIGDPDIVQKSALLSVVVILIAISEEIVWRGMVLHEMNDRLGQRRGWIVTALLYGATALPTLYTLRHPIAGFNPLLVTAAFGCGLVWTFTAARTGRVPPVAFSHAFFTYLSVVQFRLPGF